MHEGGEKEQFGVLRYAAWVIVAGGVVAVAWLMFRFFPLLLPFLLAWGISLLLAPLADKMHAHTHLPRRVCNAVLLLLTLLLIVLLLTLLVNRLIGELRRLLEWLSADGGTRVAMWIGQVRDWFFSLGERFPILGRLWGGEIEGLFSGAEEIVSGMIGETLSGISTVIPTAIAAILRALPKIMLFLAVTILACFYFALDLERINGAIRGLLPRSVQRRLPRLKQRAAGTALRWLRAYLLLMTLTFCELLIGFALLDLDYAFLPALLIALVDLFPVLGVGTVLLPWSLFCFFGGNYHLGIGLLILYGVTTIVRQIAEPRIVGESMGLHPLLTLVAMYVGFRLWGLGGMLLSPAIALALGTASGEMPDGEAGEKRTREL
ncbi:MAG: sporulation integral membrane protein YtvI [Clostridia bacterium]|nr:sporulation integral membrane protein YtvI [Clostridia bacterium]